MKAANIRLLPLLWFCSSMFLQVILRQKENSIQSYLFSINRNLWVKDVSQNSNPVSFLFLDQTNWGKMYIKSCPKPDRTSEVSLADESWMFSTFNDNQPLWYQRTETPTPLSPIEKENWTELSGNNTAATMTSQIKSHLLSDLSLSWANIHHKYNLFFVMGEAM